MASHINDLIKTALHAQYDSSGTLHLGDLLKLYAADYPDYFGMAQKQFLKDQLTALGVSYASTLHLDDLAQLYWENVSFGPTTPDGLAINASGDALLINASGDLLLRD